MQGGCSAGAGRCRGGGRRAHERDICLSACAGLRARGLGRTLYTFASVRDRASGVGFRASSLGLRLRWGRPHRSDSQSALSVSLGLSQRSGLSRPGGASIIPGRTHTRTRSAGVSAGRQQLDAQRARADLRDGSKPARSTQARSAAAGGRVASCARRRRPGQMGDGSGVWQAHALRTRRASQSKETRNARARAAPRSGCYRRSRAAAAASEKGLPLGAQPPPTSPPQRPGCRQETSHSCCAASNHGV